MSFKIALLAYREPPHIAWLSQSAADIWGSVTRGLLARGARCLPPSTRTRSEKRLGFERFTDGEWVDDPGLIDDLYEPAAGRSRPTRRRGSCAHGDRRLRHRCGCPIWLAFFVWLFEAAILIALVALALLAYAITTGYQALQEALETRHRRKIQSRIVWR